MIDFDYRQGDNETDEKYADRIVRRCDQLESELARPEAATTGDERAVLDALCHNTGYQRWWIHSGRLHFERDGQPGRIEVLLPYRCEPQPERE